jgi:hypothetical protein
MFKYKLLINKKKSPNAMLYTGVGGVKYYLGRVVWCEQPLETNDILSKENTFFSFQNK